MSKMMTPLLMAAAAIVGVAVGNLSATSDKDNDQMPRPSTLGFTYTDFGSMPLKKTKAQEIMEIIRGNYVDSVEVDTLFESVIPKMLENLDPHSVYIPAKDMERTAGELKSDFGGVGITFSIYEDTVNVMSVITGGPSSKLGVLPGDKVIKVNGHDFTGKDINNDMVMDSLRGPMGTHVGITVLRQDMEIDFDIERGLIPMTSVSPEYMIDKTIGYMAIDRFAEKTYAEMALALARLKKNGCQTVIIDLRGNTGGYLNVVAQMCNEFLEKDDMIVYTEGAHQRREDIRANGMGQFKDMGVVVLIDEYSASASEIFSGAMQDNDRGVIIGRRSFGKGLVQNQLTLNDGSGMRITIARYHTPSGRCIQKHYGEGNKKYSEDLDTRYENGEFYNADSIKLDSTAVFKTKGGRTVYGGGGIMPDIFIKADSTTATKYLQQLYRRNIPYQLSLEYTAKHRSEMESMKSDELIAHLKGIDFVPIVKAFAQKKGIAQGSLSRYEVGIVNTTVRSYIARNIDECCFYQIRNEQDEVVKKAVEVAQPAQK